MNEQWSMRLSVVHSVTERLSDYDDHFKYSLILPLLDWNMPPNSPLSIFRISFPALLPNLVKETLQPHPVSPGNMTTGMSHALLRGSLEPPWAAVWCLSGPHFMHDWLQCRGWPAHLHMCYFWGLYQILPSRIQVAPHWLRSAMSMCPKATAGFPKLQSKCQTSFALSDTYLTRPLYWVFISWGGLNRMKGRFARCKWGPFNYLKAHLIKLDSLLAWGKLNEN